MNKTCLTISFLLLLFILPIEAADSVNDSTKSHFCQQEFDYVLSELKNLADHYPILSDIKDVDTKNSTLRKEVMDCYLFVDTAYNDIEKGMIYSIVFSKNYLSSKNQAKIAANPYLYLAFYLRTGTFTGQGIVFSLENYSIDKKTEPHPSIQHRSQSGITIFANVFSDNKILEKEIRNIFEKVIEDILIRK